MRSSQYLLVVVGLLGARVRVQATTSHALTISSSTLGPASGPRWTGLSLTSAYTGPAHSAANKVRILISTTMASGAPSRCLRRSSTPTAATQGSTTTRSRTNTGYGVPPTPWGTGSLPASATGSRVESQRPANSTATTTSIQPVVRRSRGGAASGQC